ncbi:hypothetical protein CHL78_006025 [Romboutsia weinsteinii]|uniref:Uncharacterized protein n=1 Tax=Romboutsia weinsteinii TaxID=2020949 RepID=A0A371J5W5_9FIRM|nr:hypothetical protein [Romboutsia weinsteinii]RDY28149.1 hypothetical protein CHL78_006025 [Romboutsia weinsteinii]
MLNLTLNNNPRCNCKLESKVKQQVWEFENIPYIKIEGNNIKKDYTSIKVTQDNKELFSDFIQINNNSFMIKFELKDALNKTNNIKVFMDNYEEVFNISLNKIFGTVKYLDNSSVKYPIINCTNSDIVAVGDENGNFELLLNDKENSIGIFDNRYSVDMLEVWIYNVDLKQDIRLDVKIDKCEVYGIRMWEQEHSDCIHFIPMSITRINDVYSRLEDSKEEVDILSNKDSWPYLKKEDIDVYYNNNSVEIVSFSKLDDFLGKINGKNIFRNGYVISIPKLDKTEGDLIKIIFRDKYLINNTISIGVGEGYYLVK